jgi:DNA repair photolyase
MTAPVIPGLNDSELPALLTTAREAGAEWAGYVLLKLPTTVKPVFLDWLQRSYPEKSERVKSLIRSTRAGNLSDSKFGRRQVGTGQIAELISSTFDMWRKKLGYLEDHPSLNADDFCPPIPISGQMRLF